MTDHTPILPYADLAQPVTIPSHSSKKPEPLDYRPLIADEVASGALTQDQADAFLRALFTIMERFVLDGHDFAPVDKLLSGFEKAESEASSMISSKPSLEIKTKRGRE